MSIFAEEDSLCQREDNSCKRRKKCWRHEAPRKDFTWECDYYMAYAQYCPYFIGVRDGQNNSSSS